MAAVIQLTLAVDVNSADLVDELVTRTRGDERAFLRVLSRRLGAYAGGVRPVLYTARVDDFDEPGLAAPGRFTVTVTKASLVADTDQLVIGTIPLTWVASAPGDGEVLIGATDAECAVNLAEAINSYSADGARPFFNGLLVAEAAGNVVTVTGYVDVRAATLIPITEVGSGQAVSMAEWGGGFAAGTMASVPGSGISGALGIARVS